MLIEKHQNSGRVTHTEVTSRNNLEEVFDASIKVRNKLKNLILL